MNGLLKSLHVACRRGPQEQQAAVWGEPGGHREDDPVRTGAAGAQRTAVPRLRHQHHAQEDVTGNPPAGTHLYLFY